MLALQIEDKKIEDTLYSQFETVENIKQYIYDLVVEDLEDKRVLKILENDHKKDFVSRDEIFASLDSL